MPGTKNKDDLSIVRYDVLGGDKTALGSGEINRPSRLGPRCTDHNYRITRVITYHSGVQAWTQVYRPQLPCHPGDNLPPG